jgi:hypothetical protein
LFKPGKPGNFTNSYIFKQSKINVCLFQSYNPILHPFINRFKASSSNITTKVAVGIHDEANWQLIRKVIDEVLPYAGSSMINDAVSEKEPDCEQPSDQSLLVGCLQVRSFAKRLAYRNTERPVEYVCEEEEAQVKLACKVVFFEVSAAVFEAEKKVGGIYESIRLDLRDEAIRRVTAHSYFLFSDLVLTSTSTVAASTERFISVFKVPEFDAMKLQSQKGVSCFNLSAICSESECISQGFSMSPLDEGFSFVNALFHGNITGYAKKEFSI